MLYSHILRKPIVLVSILIFSSVVILVTVFVNTDSSIEVANRLKVHTSGFFNILKTLPNSSSVLNITGSGIDTKTGKTEIESDKVTKVSEQTKTPETTVDKSRITNPKTGISAAFVTLARNSDLEGILQSIESVEAKFNKNFHYDWIFLNDDEFDSDFIKEVTQKVSGNAKFGKIPPEMWQKPNDLDENRYREGTKILLRKGVPYASKESYRKMCVFESGYFYHHELVKPYSWYWRVEPEVKFFCDIDFDPFKYMIDNNKVYGTIIIPYEIEASIHTLWQTTKNFVKEQGLEKELLGKDRTKDNALYLISENDGETYNNCHFWSNFEIASLDFYRGDLYTKYFEYLQKAKGFWYERWGDAPVHTMAASLFLNRSQLHLFSRQFGYVHTTNSACPKGNDVFKSKNCDCDQAAEITFKTGFSCGKRFHDLQKEWYDSAWVSEW